ncbi:MAG: endolytic transglycosylase MltG [Candidatus Marinimicrobia bacterium]|nr:endolytic transglycosylase MltG [Candidatus Neomarinimicrobiota bacterium]
MAIKKTLIPILGISAVSIIALAILILFWPQDNPFEKIKVEIPKGASLTEIASTLKANNILSNSRTFTMAVKTLGYETDIPAGTYQLRDAYNNYSIITQLVNGSPIMRRVTILEGWSMKQIAIYLADKINIDDEEFLKLCYDPQFLNKLKLPYESLEGFLFPETYYFPEDEAPDKVIEKLVTEYQSIMTDTHRGRSAELGFSELELVTLASIIEGEAIYDVERPIISAVYHNRLRLGMRLQADPTIQYIIDDSPRRLLNKDLRIKSPYNTYLNYGLPPGPINSPGKVSILAALYPEENDYIYFVARGDGYHTFSRTQDEHNRAKKVFQKIRRENRRKNREKNKG